MTDLRYFELNDDEGLHPDTRTPEPIVGFAIKIATPTMRGGEIVANATTYIVRPRDNLGQHDKARVLPATRIVEARAGAMAAAISQLGIFHEIDPPSQRAEQHARGETQEARQAAAKNSDEEE